MKRIDDLDILEAARQSLSAMVEDRENTATARLRFKQSILSYLGVKSPEAMPMNKMDDVYEEAANFYHPRNHAEVDRLSR